MVEAARGVSFPGKEHFKSKDAKSLNWLIQKVSVHERRKVGRMLAEHPRLDIKDAEKLAKTLGCYRLVHRTSRILGSNLNIGEAVDIILGSQVYEEMPQRVYQLSQQKQNI